MAWGRMFEPMWNLVGFEIGLGPACETNVGALCKNSLLFL